MGHGRNLDLIDGPIGRTLLLFALPTLGSNVLQSLNGSINAIWVGQFLGESGLAATANAHLIMFLLFSGVFGFGMAATVLIGQFAGRGDMAGVRRVVGTAIGIFLLMAAAIACFGWLLAPGILRLLAVPPDVFELALAYLRVVFLAMPPVFMIVLLMMALRGIGDAMTPLWFMVLAVLLDMSLNPLLILGIGPFPRLGIVGSATAMLVANYVALIAMVVTIYARDNVIRLRGAEWRYLKPDPELLRPILTKGLPMGLQMLLASIAGMAMMGLVNLQGTSTVAAYGAASQLWTYIQMPAMAVGAAVSAMAAQNIGAGRWDRIGKIAWSGVVHTLVITGTMVVLLALIDRGVLGLFLPDHPETLALARHINLVVSWSFIVFGLMMIYGAVVRANGAVLVPLIIMIVSLFPIRLSFAYALMPRIGADAIWWSFPVGFVAATVLSYAYYRWGRWRELRMMAQPSTEECEEQALASSEPGGRLQPTG
jgi:putative MATE family efflux protein